MSIFRWLRRRKPDRGRRNDTDPAAPGEVEPAGDADNDTQDGDAGAIDDTADVNDGPDFDL